MSKKKPTQLISTEEIHAVYARGEEAVVELVMGLVEQIAKQEARLTELEGIVKKNSSNSSKPPSGDGFGKKTKSLRTKSEKNTGGQTDHQGKTLEWSEQVDEIVTHQVEQCQGCGADLAAEPVATVYARQVYDIPPTKLLVSEGTLFNTRSQCFEKLAANEEAIKTEMVGRVIRIMSANITCAMHITCGS